MKRGTRKSMSGADDVRNSIGNFSTRFSLPSFVKRVEKLSYDQRNAIKKTGFGNLLVLPNHMLSKNLLVELMERWSCEEHCFLLPPGKISITLMDVALILGLAVTGNSIVFMEDEPLSELEMDLGASLGKRKVSISAIETKLDSLGEVASDEFIRVFLLFTIGTLLFPNASAKVDSRYLALMNNLDELSLFAWGEAVLEEIFMWLDKRKQMHITYIGGCLIFLQIWCYEHIDIARPNLLDTCSTFPRPCRWENSKANQREWFITKFNELQDHQIIWELELSSSEHELGIVKDLLESQTNQKIAGTSIDLEDSVDEVEESNSIGLEDMEASTSSCKTDAKMERTKLPLRLQNACTTSTNSTRLTDPNTELKEENDRLRGENRLLRDQLSSRKTSEEKIGKMEKEIRELQDKVRSRLMLEEQNEELKKEVEGLRRENERLRSWEDNLAGRIEKIFLEGDVNPKEESEMDR